MHTRRCLPRRWAVLILVVASAAALQLTGCSEESPEAPPTPDLSNLPPREVLEAIARGHERIAELPGRTGLLAEEKRYSLYLEEPIIRDFFQDRKGGFFVDVGCAWPINASNTYYLEKHLGWSGIGIDALPDYAEAWARERPRSRFFAYLVSDRTADRAAFFKSKGLGLSSVSRSMASGNMFGADAEPERIEVPAITLNDLLEREGVDRIDLLSMDIEGHEAVALRGFDIRRFRPELVVAEGNDPEVTEYFRANGYAQIERYVPFDEVNRYFAPREAAAR